MDELKVISEDFRDICERCIEKWGWDAQKLKLVEECGELVQAIIKHFLKQGEWRQIIEEAVDVELMLGQLKAYQISPLWYDLRDEKLKRLRERLNNGDKQDG